MVLLHSFFGGIYNYYDVDRKEAVAGGVGCGGGGFADHLW